MGFGSFTERTVQSAQALLQSKYGVGFTADTIGDRYNTGTATLYFHPEDDSTLHFKVIYDARKKAISDNYCYAKVLRGAKQQLKAQCCEAGFEVCSELTVLGTKFALSDPEMDYSVYLKKAKPSKLYIILAVNAADIRSEQDAERLLETLTAFQRNTAPAVKLVISVHFIPAEQFAQCRAEFEEGVFQSMTRMRFYHPVFSTGINIENGICGFTAAKLFAAIKGV